MREVFIKPVYGKSGKLVARMVCYLKRRKYQRYTAAQFDARIPEPDIQMWVRANNLTIVAVPEEQ